MFYSGFQSNTGLARWASGVKALAAKPENPSSILVPIWVKERTDSLPLSSYLQISHSMHRSMLVCAHVHIWYIYFHGFFAVYLYMCQICALYICAMY